MLANQAAMKNHTFLELLGGAAITNGTDKGTNVTT